MNATIKRPLVRPRNRLTFLAVIYLTGLVSGAVFADVIPFGFSPEYLDTEHLFLPPFQWRTYAPDVPFHWLGTDRLGRDVLANLAYGCRAALLVSVPSMLIAALLGITLGGMAGYFGDTILRTHWLSVLMGLFFVGIAAFYGFYVRQITLADAFQRSIFAGIRAAGLSLLIFLTVSGIGWIITRRIRRRFRLPNNLRLPVDQLVLRTIELVTAVPRLILILSLAAYVRPSIGNLVLIAGCTYWTEPARLIRAEILRIKATYYIESARALGLRDFYVLFRHALPNALSSVIVVIAFGMMSLISLEATLSFLNIGVPPDVPSWGRLVAGVKTNWSAWWLVVFPGITLCATVLSLQSVAGFIIQQLDPRSR